MNPIPFSRRELLQTTSAGFGYLALAGLCAEASTRDAGFRSPLAPRSPHFTPRARRVIMLGMRGGPSHVDTFDYKPALTRDHGRRPSTALARGGNARTLLRSPFTFRATRTWSSRKYIGDIVALVGCSRTRPSRSR